MATDIIHQHSGRLDYYKGFVRYVHIPFHLTYVLCSNFTQFYSTKSERDRNLRKEYETQMEYRKHLQAFIDRWRYNANRAAQAQSKIKILEKLPELHPPDVEEKETFKFPDAEKISPPVLQLSGVDFGYGEDRSKLVSKGIDIDVGMDSRIAVVGPNGAGKSTLYVVPCPLGLLLQL